MMDTIHLANHDDTQAVLDAGFRDFGFSVSKYEHYQYPYDHLDYAIQEHNPYVTLYSQQNGVLLPIQELIGYEQIGSETVGGKWG